MPKMHLGGLIIPRLATSTMSTQVTNYRVHSTFSVHSTEFTVRVSVLMGALGLIAWLNLAFLTLNMTKYILLKSYF